MMIDNAGKQTLLVIENTTENFALINKTLQNTYLIEHASDSKKGLKLALSDTPPDLILLNTALPDMDGYEVCRRLKEQPETQNIPVIFIAAESSPAEEEKGLALGAVDYITKPLSPPIVKNRVKTHLAIKDSIETIHHRIYIKQSTANDAIQDIFHGYSSYTLKDESILAIASLAESYDSDITNHLRRTQHYVKAMAEQLISKVRDPLSLTPSDIALLYKSVPLHDIGKLYLPTEILQKKAGYTESEFNTMRRHTILGLHAIEQAEKVCGIDGQYLHFAKEIALSHHERWDGSGYPNGLKEKDIPLSARLMAVADVYDAIISKKTYSDSLSHEEAINIIYAGKNNLFDPEIIDAFVAIEQEINAIAARYP